MNASLPALPAAPPADALGARAATLLTLYRRSGGAWRFPLVSAHAALWFRRVDRLLAPAAPALPAESRWLLQELIAINALVGEALVAAWRDGAAGPLPALGPVRADPDRAAAMDEATRRALFDETLRWEQEVLVQPPFIALYRALRSPLLRWGVRRPPLRFAYFPATTWLRYRDFTDPAERIEKTWRCYALAERAGWAQVEAAAERAIGAQPPQ